MSVTMKRVRPILNYV